MKKKLEEKKVKKTKVTLPKNLKNLSPKEKKVAAKVLGKQGYSSRKLEKILGIDNVTIWRSKKHQTPEEMKQFETDFTDAIDVMKKRGSAMVQERILKLIPLEFRMDRLIKAGQYFEGVQTGKSLKVEAEDGKTTVTVVNYKDE